MIDSEEVPNLIIISQELRLWSLVLGIIEPRTEYVDKLRSAGLQVDVSGLCTSAV
jgi:hypothetical protein